MSSETELTSQRVDLWLDLVCLYKTRSQAQNACKAGKVEVNGQSAKAHRSIREGDEIRIPLEGSRPDDVPRVHHARNDAADAGCIDIGRDCCGKPFDRSD